jgi:hypothetical protein
LRPSVKNFRLRHDKAERATFLLLAPVPGHWMPCPPPGLLIARCDQRLSNASDRSWRRRWFRGEFIESRGNRCLVQPATALTDPCMTVSRHTFSSRFRLTQWIMTRMACPLGSTAISPFQRYYEAVRPSSAYRYFRPCGATACAFSLTTTDQVLKFRIEAQIKVTLLVPRTPPGRPGELHPEAESARGIAPRAAHRSVLEPLDSHGSCHPPKAAASHQDPRVPPVAR